MNLIELPSAVMGSPPAKNATGIKPDRSENRTDQIEIKEGNNTTPREVQKKEATEPEEKTLAAVEFQKVERAAKRIQEFLDENGRELNIYVNQENGQMIVEVYRESDGKLIRKIPPEDLLKPQNGPRMSGLLLEENA